MISTAIVSAQDTKKAARQARKELRIQQNMKYVREVFSSNDLTFVPTQLTTNTSGTTIITTYNFLKLQQNTLSTDLLYMAYGQGSSYSPGATPSMQYQQLRINTTIFEITKKEQTDIGYMMVIRVLANNQYYTMTLNTNSRNNLTTMSIQSLQNPEIFYTGTIRKN